MKISSNPKPIIFHSSLLLGDLIYALPGIKQVCRRYNRNALIYLGLNTKWPMADVIDRNNGITLTQQSLDMIYPLLINQDYIEDVRPHNNEPFAVNLDKIMEAPINLPYGYLPRWFFYVFPEMSCDLTVPWLDVGEYRPLDDMIIINRTSRYHNPNISYKFLQQYSKNIVFIGLEDEHKAFCDEFFEVTPLKIDDYLDMAIAISSCRLFIGNQSFCFAIAEALKVPRILELYSPLPNVIPHGERAFDFYGQGAFEYYVKEMMI